MTSMIDVVFLLLIFFLVTTTFVKPERQIATNIKVNESSSGTAFSDLEPAVIDVIQVGEKPVFRIGAVTTSDVERLRKLLNSFENKSEGAFVRVGPDAMFDGVAQAIGACRDAGFASVSYISAE